MWQRRPTPPRSVACPCPILPWRLSDMRQGGLSKLPLRRMMAALRPPRRPAMHDIVIRGGTVIDGSGKPAFTGDVAIAGGRIAAVGGKQGPARRDIDADGLLDAACRPPQRSVRPQSPRRRRVGRAHV